MSEPAGDGSVTFRTLLPEAVGVAEGVPAREAEELLSEEQAYVAAAVDARRREFAAGRALARRALTSIDEPVGPIPVGPSRAPVWPPGIVGSITHCDVYLAAAVARRQAVTAIGIDAEPSLPLPDGLVEVVARPGEVSRMGALGTELDRLLFSAKESVYKAWFPLTNRWLDFHDVEVTFTATGPSSGELAADLIEPAHAGPDGPTRFVGRYAYDAERLLTAVVVLAADAGRDRSRR